MDNYLKEIIRIVELRGSDVDGIIIVNSEGIVEYFSNWGGSYANRLPDFFLNNAAGKHLLDVYQNLDEESSTVMQTLRTGKTTVGSKQELDAKDYTLTIMATTYPILENGVVKGAVDAAKIISLRKKGEKKEMTDGLYVLDDILTCNDEMNRLKEKIVDLSESSSPVLIYGETGTGKQLVAESIHTLSHRRNKPFISQNCAAIPENLLESLFFGTEKGGFTGAETRQGLFELADGGTLFLDEINSMNPGIQGKLLKALDDQRVRRIGGKEDIDFDVRIICASNEDLEALVEKGAMRADLYYRVSVVKLTIPPLQKRPEDIPLLVRHFIDYFNKRMGRQITGVSMLVEQMFRRWEWPGNIRELRNTIESAFNLEKSDTITLNSVGEFLAKVNRQSDLEEVSSREEPSYRGEISLQTELENYERKIIRDMIGQSRTLADAAQKLKISPQKLQYRINKLGLREE